MDPFQSLLKPGRSVIFYLMFSTHWPHASTQPYSPWRHFEIGFYQPTIRIYMLNSNAGGRAAHIPYRQSYAAVAGPIDLDPTVTDTNYCELRNVTEMRWGLECDGRPAPRVPSGVLNGGPLFPKGHRRWVCLKTRGKSAYFG